MRVQAAVLLVFTLGGCYQSLLDEGERYFLKCDYAKASNILQKAAAKRPLPPDALVRAGICNLKLHPDTALGPEHDVVKGLSANPSIVEDRFLGTILAKALLSNAIKQMENGRSQEALFALDVLEKYVPKNRLQEMGAIGFEVKHKGLPQGYSYEQELLFIRRLLELFPKDLGLMDSLATIYEKKKDWKELANVCRSTLEVAPTKLGFASNLAILLLIADEVAEAEAVMEKCRAARAEAKLADPFPNSVDWYWLEAYQALRCWKKGDIAGAKQHYSPGQYGPQIAGILDRYGQMTELKESAWFILQNVPFPSVITGSDSCFSDCARCRELYEKADRASKKYGRPLTGKTASKERFAIFLRSNPTKRRPATNF